MAKISALPLAGPLDGSEDVPLVQNGDTVRINPADHLAYIAQGAEAARDQAADLVLPNNIFLDVDLATAHAAVANGTVFKMVSSLTGLAEVRKRTAGGSDILYMEATTAALQNGGDARIGRTGGTTVKDALDNAAIVGVARGLGGNAPSFQQGDWNFQHSGEAACGVAGGTRDQPMINGGKNFIQTFQCDGVTAAFEVTPGFVVADLPIRNILLFRVTALNRAQILQSETTHFTVAGKGTGTVTIIPNEVWPATDKLDVRLYDPSDSSATSVLLNYAVFGYDIANDGKGPMTIAMGAHQTINNCPGGHNFIGGGSGHKARNNTSYSALFCLSNDMDAALAGFAGGMRNLGTGTAPTVFGASNDAGPWALAIGELSKALPPYSFARGRRAMARMAGGIASACGSAADADSGMVGDEQIRIRRTSTSASLIQMIPPTGTGTYVIPPNSTADVAGFAWLQDIATKEFRKIAVQTTVQRDAGTITTVVGLHSASAAQYSEIDRSAGLVVPANGWRVQITGSSASGGFTCQLVGEAGRTIIGYAVLKITLIDPTAAVV